MEINGSKGTLKSGGTGVGVNPTIDILLFEPEISRDIKKELFYVSYLQLSQYLKISNGVGDENTRNQYENLSS